MHKGWSTKNDRQHKQFLNRTLDWGASEEMEQEISSRSGDRNRQDDGSSSYSRLEDGPVDENHTSPAAENRP